MKGCENILVERTDCMLYAARPDQSVEHGTGWIGGNAPEFFDDQAAEGIRKYYFYLSLTHPFNRESMISIFIPENYEETLDNNVYPDCSIRVIEHPLSKESTKDLFTHPGLIKHAITGGEVCNDEEAVDQSFLIKLGGNPRLIQHEDYYFTKLEEESFSFFFQVDEDGYPETFLRDDTSYPFRYGSLYIFGRIRDNDMQNPVAGFWQFS